jgi:hypothetical protein
MKLYVDDAREAPQGWTVARTYEEAMQRIASGKVTELSLDHDLGAEGTETGYDILKMIERAMLQVGFTPPPVIKIHTANPAGHKNMKLALESINKLKKAADKSNPNQQKKKKKKKKKRGK